MDLIKAVCFIHFFFFSFSVLPSLVLARKQHTTSEGFTHGISALY